MATFIFNHEKPPFSKFHPYTHDKT